jgi:hypothetical protein
VETFIRCMRKRLKIAKQNFKNQSILTSRGSRREPLKKETDEIAKDASSKNRNCKKRKIRSMLSHDSTLSCYISEFGIKCLFSMTFLISCQSHAINSTVETLFPHSLLSKKISPIIFDSIHHFYLHNFETCRS